MSIPFFKINLKFINIINDRIISQDKKYLSDIFGQLCPFLNIDLFYYLDSISTVIKPTKFSLSELYKITKYNNDNNSKEQSLIFFPQSLYTVKKQISTIAPRGIKNLIVINETNSEENATIVDNIKVEEEISTERLLGRMEERKAIIINMLNSELPIEMIENYTKVSIREIENIRREM
mgnify:CR=1 FL=1